MKLFSRPYIIAIFIVLNIAFVYISVSFVFMDVFRHISHMRVQTQLVTALALTARNNYENIEENRLQLEQLQQARRIVHYHQLPYTLVNVSNLMNSNEIAKNYFRITTGNYIQESIFSTNLIIGGIGSHANIIHYIYSLNQKQDLIFIESVNVTQEVTGNYSHVSISISVPATR